MSIPSPFAAVDVDFNRSTEYALLLKSDAGYAVLTYGPNFPGPSTTPTGLVGTTTYTATVTINGTDRAISILGSAAQTFADLITEINADISTWATAALIGDSIVITVTNPTAGPTSTITVVDSGTNHLFASVKGNYFGLVNNISHKGADDYVIWNRLDPVTQANVSHSIDSFLAATTANTNIAWTPGSDALSFPTGTPGRATETGLTRSTVYQLNVAVDGGTGIELLINLNILETPATVTFNHLLEAINNALLAQSIQAHATFDSGSTLTIRITSKSVGTSSTVVITDGASNGLIAALSAFGPVNAVASTAGTLSAAFTATPVVTTATIPAIGAAGTNYDVTLTVDAGSATTYTVNVTSTDSIGAIAILLGTAVTAVANVAVVSNAIVFTSKTSGVASKVVVTHPTSGANPDLFDTIATALSGTVAFTQVDGTAAAGVNGSTNVTFPVTKAGVDWNNWADVVNKWPSLTGNIYGPLFTSGNNAHVRKENKPASKGNATVAYVYWDGSVWKFYNNDATVGSTVNPPNPA